MMTSAEIRKQFLDFFRQKSHEIVPSAPIVIKNDPTLLFTNAGMNQFKDYFLGNRKSPFPRVADTQKCLRVSGKHNDLEEVGVDTYHHTMFEMLGNWSFGDPGSPTAGYFKKEAIEWSWELLTKIYKIPVDRIYVTVFEGDESERIPKDEEAYNEWKKWIAEDRILLGNKKDNFWEMGDTGPCGPCTEIHVDSRPDKERKQLDGKQLVNNDHPQVIEIWNNVFIQFNRLKDGSLEPLPARHVDTGMGLERLVRVLQQKHSNYDTDLFTGTITETEKITGKKYRASADPSDVAQWGEAVAFRVIADHIRAICFTIADGQLPSNTGAGYVIRRILRRAVRYYYTYLEYKQPLLFKLVQLLADQFTDVFPELLHQKDFVGKVVREEEEAFLRTLDKGLKKIDELIHQSKASGKAMVDGKAAFELYDTYGFPFDLTRLILTESALSVDEKEFQAEMQMQKDRSRAATTLDTTDWVVIHENGSSDFKGYESLETSSRVLKYRKIKSKGKESFQLVLDKTPFYAESGGQVGDTGLLLFGEEKLFVVDTKKENDLIIHFTEALPKAFEGTIVAQVDEERRKRIALNHSATHLLHAALRRVLGNHVAQKGSLVNDEYLRFDFSHFSKMTDEEIEQVEKIVNQKIRENIPVVIREMPREEALQMGAMALFGEKYSDVVRVVIIDPSYSLELCGGTHVAATGEIGFFTIKHETAVAAGVRRVEAITGEAAEQYFHEQSILLRSVKELLKHPKELLKSLDNLLNENNELKKKLEQFENRALSTLAQQVSSKAETINGISFIGQVVEVSSADALKKLCFDLKKNFTDYIAVLCANVNGKSSVAVGISDSVVGSKGLDAGKIIKQHIAPLIKGGGGGQPTLATAGGQDISKFLEVIAEVKNLVQ